MLFRPILTPTILVQSIINLKNSLLFNKDYLIYTFFFPAEQQHKCISNFQAGCIPVYNQTPESNTIQIYLFEERAQTLT